MALQRHSGRRSTGVTICPSSRCVSHGPAPVVALLRAGRRQTLSAWRLIIHYLICIP